MVRVIFLQRIWYEYGGPEILSAVLKQAGYQVSLYIGQNAKDFINQILDDDIIAFSTMTGEHHWSLNIATEIKQVKRITTVFGGPHATFFPDLIHHPAVDIVCCGEGEQAILDLVNAYTQGKSYEHIANLTFKRGTSIVRNPVRPLVKDLDWLPFPDREIYYDKYRFFRSAKLKPFIISRGCPYNCSFCFNATLRSIYFQKGTYVRFRRPRNVVEEIKTVRNKYGLTAVYFADDLFVYNQTWLKEFVSMYREEVNLPYVCAATVNTLTEENVILLKNSGCRSVSFGIETGNEKIRTELLNKHIANQKIIELGKMLKKYKLKFMTFNMLGLPGETVNQVKETISLNIQIGTDYPRCSILTPYPGTKLAELYKSQFNIQQISSTNQQVQISFKVTQPDEIINLHYFFQTIILFPWLQPFIYRLIPIKPNFIFRLWWMVIYFYVFVRSELRNPWQTFIFALKTYRLVVTK